ncbi:uncharacterized protein LOC128884161 isoform X2 [Hylaeus volcanicus]|uniref:uncharacterized protein LOC128884161 isoform X2 n=1 Tax=Hylaeus volcanicus TaxID=313075 RepID=UPI0023B7B17D|nr:uncharacterized protein LOC128884161 isoform X2 [Hylaeus volcanicus]
MISWGVTITCKNTGQFSSAKGFLHLKQAVLLKGKKVYLKVRFFKNNNPQEFVLGVLTEKQPNLILKHEFRESVQFLIEGNTDSSLSLFGNLSVKKDAIDFSVLKMFSVKKSLDSLINIPSIVELLGGDDELNVSNEMSDRVVDVTDEIGLEEIDNTSGNAMSESNTLKLNNNLKEKTNLLNLCETNKMRIETEKDLKSLERTEATSINKKTKTHEPSTTVFKKESEDIIENPLKQRTLPGGITYSILSIGQGKIATVGKRVRVKYEGRLATTGEMIKGFDLGIRGMLVKEKRKIFLPSRMAYGKEKVGTIPPNSNLIFEITLLSVS